MPAATTAISIRLRSGPLARPMDFLGRTWVSGVAALGATALLVWMAFDAGGYFPSAYAPAGAIAWALCALLLIARPPAPGLSGTALAGLGALTAFAAWTGISQAWSLDAPAAIEEMQRDLAYVALFGLGLIAAAPGRAGGRVAWLIGAAGTAIVVTALIDRLLVAGVDVAGGHGYRLQYPLTYWNALGALASMTAVLAAGLAADYRASIAARATCAVAATLAMVAMYLTLSRGAWLALGLGLVVLFAVSPRRMGVLAVVLVVGLAVTTALLRLRHYPALVTDPTLGDGRVHDGRRFAPELLALALAAGGAMALAAVAGRRIREINARHRHRWRQVGVGLVVLAIAGLALTAGTVHSATDATGDYIDRQWQDFLQAANERSGTARLTTAGGSRSEIYDIALDGATAHPVAGDGAGSFRVRWARDRDDDGYITNAHSLYLETLSDLGIPGLAFVLAFLAAVAAAALVAIRRPGTMRAAEAAAVAAAFAVWAGHTGVDWDWQMTAVTGFALLLAATLFGPPPRPRRPPRRRLLSAGASFRLLGVACAALAVYLGISGRDARRVKQATELIQSGDYAAAAGRAHDIRSGPAGMEALVVAAFAARGRGDLAGAETAFADAVGDKPNDWALRRVRAENLLALGDTVAARREMTRAVELNPRLRLPNGFVR